MQLPTSKKREIIKRLVGKLMSSMCLNWEHMKSSLRLETEGRSAHHRRCLWFYPIILKPLKNVDWDVRWMQTPLTASSPTLSRVLGYLCGYLVTVTMQNCFDETKKETEKQKAKKTKYKHTKGQQNQKTTKNWPGRGRGELKNKNKKDRKGNSKIK